MYTYHAQYCPGSENAAADALSRVCGAIGRPGDLSRLHESLGHPGIARFWHFIRSKNLPFSIEEVRQTCSQCTTCSALKPRFYQPPQNQFIRATQAWERISIEFKGPLTTSHRGNKYLLIVVDGYSRFPFAFACKDTLTSSVTNCLALLFSLVGFPYVHSDRGTAFMSKELKDYLHTSWHRYEPFHAVPSYWQLPVLSVQSNCLENRVTDTEGSKFRPASVGTYFARRSLRGTDLSMYSNRCFSPCEVLLIFSSIDVTSFPPPLDDHSWKCPAEEVCSKQERPLVWRSRC